MITVRKAGDRGHFDFGWMDTWHSFSFGEYHDPRHRGFRSLRVINEDRIAPGSSFEAHSHSDMEILTYVLKGLLEHQDSVGNRLVIRAGEVQKMTAGTGITHSESNPSKDEPVYLFQIWIRPAQRGLSPAYEQKMIGLAEANNQLRLMPVKIQQDVSVYDCRLKQGGAVTHPVSAGRGVWVQVIEGAVDLDGNRMEGGDGAAVEDQPDLRLTAKNGVALFLLFDLA